MLAPLRSKATTFHWDSEQAVRTRAKARDYKLDKTSIENCWSYLRSRIRTKQLS
jgi:hypothetical protein